MKKILSVLLLLALFISGAAFSTENAEPVQPDVSETASVTESESADIEPDSSVAKRLLRYVTIDTHSLDAAGDHTPSTDDQFILARLLECEMKDIGLRDIFLDEENCYVYGFLPATDGLENVPCIAFISHLDTSESQPSAKVQPRIITDYDGKDIPLGDSGVILSPSAYPELNQMIGKSLVVTDGTTLLGGDDKAGISIILDFCEKLVQNNTPHGRIAVCFTPDEEIGHGADLLDLGRLNADFGYTIDGTSPDGVCGETFNAARAKWIITGVETHPGSANGLMVNSAKIGVLINSMLPSEEYPENTSGREGFYHLVSFNGDCGKTEMDYLIRDFDNAGFEARKTQMKEIEERINQQFGAGTAVVAITDEYENMKSVLDKHPEVLNLAFQAIENLGLDANQEGARGGTDGSALSFRGLPCPNLGTGVHAEHSLTEFVCIEEMEQMVQILLNINRLNCGKS